MTSKTWFRWPPELFKKWRRYHRNWKNGETEPMTAAEFTPRLAVIASRFHGYMITAQCVYNAQNNMTLMELRGILETAGNAIPVRNTRMTTAELLDLVEYRPRLLYVRVLLVAFVSNSVLLCSAKRRNCVRCIHYSFCFPETPWLVQQVV
jgi:hypothetical protein